MDDTQELVEWRKENNMVSNTLKYCLLGFSYIFWLIGALFAAIGGYSISQKTGYRELSNFATVPGIILAMLGCMIFIVSTFGVIGSFRENLCYLRIYKIILIVILVFEVCAGLVGFAYWSETKKIVDSNLSTAIRKYTENDNLREVIDYLQRNLACCGSLTVDDWDSNPYYSCRKKSNLQSCGVPWSCCLDKYDRNRQCGYGVRRSRTKVELSTKIHITGCLDKAFEYLKSHMFKIGGLAIGFTFPMILIIFMTRRLEKQIRKQITLCSIANEKYQLQETY